jgi:rhodanese-related sulfurtransferase
MGQAHTNPRKAWTRGWRPALAGLLGALLLALLATLLLGALIDGEVPPAQARAWQQDGALLVDVRSPWERRRSAAPGTLHAPWREVVAALEAQGIGREQTLVLYCMAGPRARYAAWRLRAAGFTAVHELDGGHAALLPGR